MDLQPTLENKLVKIRPLLQSDFEALYRVASDPLIWEQHPNNDRYRKEVFEDFFSAAIESRGAFLIYNNQSGMPIGSSRYYDLDIDSGSVAIGFTFLARDHWGSIYNGALKSLMINHAFRYIDTVILHVGVNNIRSQKAVEKLGALKAGVTEKGVYNGETIFSYIYRLDKDVWIQRETAEITNKHNRH